MKHRSIVRNAQYRRGSLNIRQRHNERQNMDYMNDDIIAGREALNIHFKKPTGSYESMFDTMVADKTISTRGLTKDPFIIDELVYGINTTYFEERGGYEYAKEFFREAYQCAINEIGGEEYILSAVMHADERNKALSDELGKDVYHYHMHVTYVPVVDKEIRYRNNNKNPELAGKLKEVIKQVSHSKKWGKKKQYDNNGEIIRNSKGKPVFIYAYSILQDNFYNHMKEKGYTGFERGERGSTAEHLSVLEFKTKKESERANNEALRAEYENQRADSFTKKIKLEQKAAIVITEIVDQKQELAKILDDVIDTKESVAISLDDVIYNKESTISGLNEITDMKKKQLENLDKKAAVIKQDAMLFSEIERIGSKKTISGNVTLTQNDWTTVSELAKEGIRSRGIIKELKEKVSSLFRKITGLEKRLEVYEGKGINDQMKYQQAIKRAPRRLREVITDILRKPPERELPISDIVRNRNKNIGR